MKIRYLVFALSGLLSLAAVAQDEAGAGMVSPSVNINASVRSYPQLSLIPDSPVYYNPNGDLNYFFYGGQYWLYENDNWYASDWYDGPWQFIQPMAVPLFLLRVPVRYYHRPPAYFRDWSADAAPRWGEHWGHDWEQRRHGWDQWDRHAVPQAAPLPSYQNSYSGDSYPRDHERQKAIRAEHYNYQPHEPSSGQKGHNSYQAPAPHTQQQHNSQPAPTPHPSVEHQSKEHNGEHR